MGRGSFHSTFFVPCSTGGGPFSPPPLGILDMLDIKASVQNLNPENLI